MKRLVHAFSIVELLVVVAVLSLLVSLTLPALTAAREHGRNTQCLSKLRQVYLLSMAYREDNRQYYPGNWAYRYASSGLPAYDVNWGNAIFPYLPDGMNVVRNPRGLQATPARSLLMCPATLYIPRATVSSWNTEVYPFLLGTNNGFIMNYTSAMQFGGGNDVSWVSASDRLRFGLKRDLGNREGIAFLGEIAGNDPYFLYTGAGNSIRNHFGRTGTNIVFSHGAARSFHESLAVARLRAENDPLRLWVW